MQSFKAFRIHEQDGRIAGRFDTIGLDDLAAGEVVVRVRYSTINYKDALAATGAGRILRRYPLVGGIDLAGSVVSSVDVRFKAGDEVLVTGCGLSETHDGGYAEYARVSADWVIPRPKGLTLADTMRLGTAGFTAGLDRPHGAQRPGAGPGRDRRDRRERWRRLARDRHAGRPRLRGRGRQRQAGGGRLPRGDRRAPRAPPPGAQARQAPARNGRVGGRDRQHRRRDPDLADADRRLLRQHRLDRPSPGRRPAHDGHAVHPAGRQPARHQLGREPARRAAADLGAARDRPEAAAPRAHLPPHDRLRRAAGGLRRFRRRPRPRPHAGRDRLSYNAPHKTRGAAMSTSPESAGARLWSALARERPLQVVGAVNAYSARLAERAGFQALYLSGAGVANASFGLPDLGMTSLNDVCEDIRRVCGTTSLPLLVDADTGWGTAFNIARTVREFIRAGAAGLHIEDQVQAKRCGHRPGKALVPPEEMVDRLRAAVDGRTDPRFVIMARTDAHAVEGQRAAVERAQAYVAAGADMIFEIGRASCR